MATVPSAVAEKQKDSGAPIINDDDEADTSPLLKHDEEELREVNVAMWWSIDAVFAFIATYLTHSDEDMGLLGRLAATVFILAFGFGMCHIYFNCGLQRPMSGQHPIDKWWHMFLTHIGNIFFFWEWCVSLWNLFRGYYEEGTNPIRVIITVSLGFYIALWLCDLIAGVVHWFGDTTDMYFFAYHHRDPRYMTKQSYVHHCFDSIGLALALSPIFPFMRTHALWATVRLVAVQANEAHAWSHCTSEEVPTFIQYLQKATIVLSWKAHKQHHKAPHLVDYCVFNGWANPIMNKVLPGPVTNWVERNIRDNPRWHEIKRILDT